MLIQETVQKFSWLIDGVTNDPSDALKVFTPDLKFGLSREPCKPDEIKGFLFEDLDGFAKFILSIQAKYAGTQHLNCNTEITITGPDSAIAKTYARNYHLKKEEHGGGVFAYYGYYTDTLTKTPEGWRIKQRLQVPFFMTGTPSP